MPAIWGILQYIVRMDHKNTFTGKQLKKSLLEKQIFGESNHKLFWSFAL